MPPLQIGEVARRAGISPVAIRYYERVGVLPPPARTAAGYRIYDPRVLVHLRFIRRAQALGFSLEEIAHVLRLYRQGQSPCDAIAGLARRRAAAIDAQIRALERTKADLENLVTSWETSRCERGNARCVLIEANDECGRSSPGPATDDGRGNRARHARRP